MDREIVPALGSISSLFQNIHVDVSLSGWPAAVSASVICATIFGIYALKCQSETTSDEEEDYYDDEFD